MHSLLSKVFGVASLALVEIIYLFWRGLFSGQYGSRASGFVPKNKYVFYQLCGRYIRCYIENICGRYIRC
jgi:hypothetical protein